MKFDDYKKEQMKDPEFREVYESLRPEYENANVHTEDDYIDAEELDIMKEFRRTETPGGNMRFYRNLKGLTQNQLAEVLGTTKQAVSAMENNRRAISRRTAAKLASFFCISASTFIF